jgi:hypothetical protein
LGSNFNDDLRDERPPSETARPSDADAVPDHTRDASPLAPTAPPTTPLVSEAVIKFRSCRWRRPPDEGVECCGHRDVLPLAGSVSFDPQAWCPDCAFFKLRRTPKKRVEMHRY